MPLDDKDIEMIAEMMTELHMKKPTVSKFSTQGGLPSLDMEDAEAFTNIFNSPIPNVEIKDGQIVPKTYKYTQKEYDPFTKRVIAE